MKHSGRCTLSAPSALNPGSPLSSTLPAAASGLLRSGQSAPLHPGQRGRALAECRHRKKQRPSIARIAKPPYSKTRPVASQEQPTSMIVFSLLTSLFEERICAGRICRTGPVRDCSGDDSAIWPIRKRDRTTSKYGVAARTAFAVFCFVLAAIAFPDETLSNPLPTGPKHLISSEVSIAQIPPGLSLRFKRRSSAIQVHPRVETDSELKKLAEQAAASHTLPTDYFLRLIRQESGFNPNSISRSGAQGIAQFMPGTAFARGLKDPFDPAEALPKSAEFLNELRDQFGNLGLATAAYNAGPERVRRWLAGKSQLPHETIDYVRVITGHDAMDWAKSNDLAINPSIGPFSSSSRPRFNRLSWESQLLATLEATSAQGSMPSALIPPQKLGELSLCSRCIVQSAY
jgi:Transglycosylase SLT domain